MTVAECACDDRAESTHAEDTVDGQARAVKIHSRGFIFQYFAERCDERIKSRFVFC